VSPVDWLFVVGTLALVRFLYAPITLPIGPAYWDLVMLMDSGYRLTTGQLPHVDYFQPFGPLPPCLGWLVRWAFPAAHPILSAQISYALLLLPLLWLVLRSARPPRVALALAGLFFALALLPANFSEFPEQFLNSGAAGYGIYNRQAGYALYVLVTAMFFARSTRLYLAVGAAVCTCLFFSKISAFIVAFSYFILGALFRRVAWRWMLAVLAPTFVCAGLVESWGVTSAYLADMASMLDGPGQIVEGWHRGVIDRLKEGVTLYLRYLGVGIALVASLLVFEWRALRRRLVGARLRPHRALRDVLRLPAMTVSLLLLGALLCESQNTGSQSFAYLLPAMLWLLAHRTDRVGERRRIVGLLAGGFCCLVGAVAFEKAVRVTRTARWQPGFPQSNLAPFGASVEPGDHRRAPELMRFIESNAGLFDEVARLRADVGWYYQNLFQVLYFLSVDQAVNEFRTWSKGFGDRPWRVVAIDFVDPFPMLLGTMPLEQGAVVHDLYRTVSEKQTARLKKRYASADVILERTCWQAGTTSRFAALLTDNFRGRRNVRFGPCWIGHVAGHLVAGVERSPQASQHPDF
jgi:hypothetical protein